jgi:hypothetical protein
MNLAAVSKALAAAVGGGAMTTGAFALTLPDGVVAPWWAYAAFAAAGIVVNFLVTYYAPKNAERP